MPLQCRAGALLIHDRREISGQLTMTAWAGAVHAQSSVGVFVLDGEELVFTTGGDSVKSRHLRRDPRIALVADDERPPFAFVHLRGRPALSDDPELLRYATQVGGRYMGGDRADEFGLLNGVPGELLVRVTVERMIAETDVAGQSDREGG